MDDLCAGLSFSSNMSTMSRLLYERRNELGSLFWRSRSTRARQKAQAKLHCRAKLRHASAPAVAKQPHDMMCQGMSPLSTTFSSFPFPQPQNDFESSSSLTARYNPSTYHILKHISSPRNIKHLAIPSAQLRSNLSILSPFRVINWVSV